MSSKSDVQSQGWTKHWIQICAVVEADIRKLRHDPSELLTRMIQPILWLMIYGQAMANTRAIPTGKLSYIDYITPGILAQSTLFISIFYGISLIWERDMGILHRVLVTPTPRSFLVLGRAFAGSLRALSQILVIYPIAIMLGVNLRFDFLALLGVCGMVLIGGALFSTFSLLVALIVKKRERFMGLGQVITLPLFFASNALYPIEIMPSWIRTFSIFNPLTYQVDAMRSLMVVGEPSYYGLPFDFGISLLIFVILLAIASWNYPKIIY